MLGGVDCMGEGGLLLCGREGGGCGVAVGVWVFGSGRKRLLRRKRVA